jgi:hypothetical protein
MFKRFLCGVAAALILCGAGELCGQEANPMTFEVATVKPNKGDSAGGYFRLGRATVALTNQTVRNMIRLVYQSMTLSFWGDRVGSTPNTTTLCSQFNPRVAS